NERTQKVEIKPVVEVQHYKYNDSLVEIKTKDIDWQVTGNHKLYLGKRIWAPDGPMRIGFEKYDAFEAAQVRGRRYLFRHKEIVDDDGDLGTCDLWDHVPNELNTIVIRSNRKYDRKFADSSRFAHYEFAPELRHSKAGRYYLTSKSLFEDLAIAPEDFERRYDCKIFVKNFPSPKSSYTNWNFDAQAIFELIGWYVTEGHARIGKSRRGYNFTRISIAQHAKHAENRNTIAAMIQALGIRAEKQNSAGLSFSSHVIANFLISECGNGSRDKHLPSFVFSAPVELRRILFETMMCGDGNLERGVYSSISQRLANDFRHLAFTLGIETSVSQEKLKSGSPIFRVKLFKRAHHVIEPKDLTLRPVRDLDVYCITAQDNHVIYAGRNGKLGWIGQSYGVMGADIFPLYCLPVADSIAAIGRSTIHKAIDKCREIGIEVVYSDSVLPDTPIVIRRKDRSIDIVPIESLIPKTHTPNRYDKFGKLEVLTESGFSRIKYAYRHKVKKKGYRILTRKGYVECTEDHSLVIDGREVTPAKLKVGDRVDQVPFKTESKIAINSDLAWLFGFFVAEGTCGAYRNHPRTPDLVKYSWRIVNLDEEKLRRAQTIIQQCLGLETTIIDIRKSSATYGLVPKGEAKLLVDYFKVMCYRGSEKAVPRVVLNAHVEAKKAFIEGLVSGDGTMDRSGILSLDQIHKSIIAGMTSMLEELHIEHTIDTRSDKPNVCRLRVIRDTADPRIMPADVIRKIETFDIEGQVYDLETENHHFCGGVGNILLHNTDSIFLKEPSSTAVEEMANWAHGTLGVDLEVDKEYRYVVFSDLKKNYLGVKPDGTVDVKGLTGKKSHTPPFIRKAFYDILGILGKVSSQKDFESAKESIKMIVQENAKKLEAHEIPIEDLSFNVMINKSLGTYGKKDGSKTMEGRDNYKGLPQHIKAAKMLEGRRELRAGDVISYVKIKTADGVKPVELAKPDEIDTEKYLEAMESTFEQVLSVLNFDFKAVLGKPRQQSLDELFWSR
ncbi:MAG: LAGLIDADG family homing endonuclease, partial [Nitrososphaera sp.]